MRGSLFDVFMEQKVIQYSRDGELIKIWDSMTLASVCTGDSLYIINRQCRGLPIKRRILSFGDSTLLDILHLFLSVFFYCSKSSLAFALLSESL